MKPVSPIIQGENHQEEDLNRGNSQWSPLPAIQLKKGVWLARWELNEEEKRTVAETGSIYVRMFAVDGDELIMPHALFVEKPVINKPVETENKPSQPIQNKSEEFSKDAKDEIRLLIQEEISKAFDAALNAALSNSVSISDLGSVEKQQERERQNAVVRRVGNAVKNALRDLKDEAYAKIIEKTDPARAEVIRRLKPEF